MSDSMVEMRVVEGKRCFVCRSCGEVLVRIQPGGILGDTLNGIDELVIQSHFVTNHERVK